MRGASDDLVRRWYDTPGNHERLARARSLAQERSLTAAQVVIAYVLHLPAPIVAIVGSRTPDEVASALTAAETELTPAEMDWLDLLSDGR